MRGFLIEKSSYLNSFKNYKETVPNYDFKPKNFRKK